MMGKGKEIYGHRVLTAVEARGILEKEFFPDGVTPEQIRLLDTVEALVHRSFVDGGLALSESKEGWSNNACLGYVILGLQNLNTSPEDIQRIVRSVYSAFDDATIDEAKHAYNKSPY